MAQGTFATAITCMDGRVQKPTSDWTRQYFNADYVDTITEAGPDGIMANGPAETIAAIRKRVEISINAHGSKAIVLAAHDDCAGNPVSKEHHLEHLAEGAKRIASWGLPAEIVTLWINDQWQVEVVEQH